MRATEQRYKWLLLPIENYVREFHGKLLLSVVAAERGWATIMGYKGHLRHHLPHMHGAAIEINMTNEGRIEHYLKQGWKVSAWDEEGLIYLNGDEYCRRRVDEAAIRQMDCVFMWGKHQQDDVARHLAGIRKKSLLSGNPRADLLRPDLRQFYAASVAGIAARHGKYILINTNFGYVNHYFGKDYIFNTLRGQGRIANKEQGDDQRAREEHQAAIMRAFIQALPALSKHFPQHQIVIRPHPSEDFDAWRAAARPFPNVAMIHEGDAVPWLLGAEAVIHNSCTTGVQAYLLDRPVISYMPVHSDKYDQFLPNALSVEARDADELLALVGASTSDASAFHEAHAQDRRAVAREYISSLDGPWASDLIMDKMDELHVKPEPLDPTLAPTLRADRRKTPAGPGATVRRGLRGLRDWLRGADSPILDARRTWETYRRQRFPDLTFDEMRVDLEMLQEATGRFADVRLCHTSENLICVLPPEA